jgi:DNA invertase Pin-like site-specific DNA recombinase
MAANYIAYYRVSTERQGISGLGLDAQREAVHRYIAPELLTAEYTEVESGKRHDNRPQLLAALAECKKRKATLVIAKLDRLGRNVAFISALMEAGVEFVCCDNPHATPLMIHMLAAFAQHERLLISERTKAAMAQAKLRGTVFGNPNLHLARAASAASNRTPASAPVLALMQEARAAGATLRQVAAKLNSLGLRTTRGSVWYAATVATELGRLAA